MTLEERIAQAVAGPLGIAPGSDTAKALARAVVAALPTADVSDLNPTQQRAAWHLLATIERMLDGWAELPAGSPERRELWTRIHDEADTLRGLLGDPMRIIPTADVSDEAIREALRTSGLRGVVASETAAVRALLDQAVLAALDRQEGAEVRADRDAYRAALVKISEWDCLNPPQSDLLGDLPWLRSVVDAALDGDQ
jgi:hypothetical protein